MIVKKIKLINFRSVKNIEFEFEKQLNVFVGVNGSGKTTLLDSLITSLSWLINRIQRENVSGKHISENDIRNNEPYSTIETFIKSNGQIFNWKLVKTRKGETTTEKSKLSEVSRLADFFRIQLKESKKLPVIAYYPVNRVVKDISPEISSKDDFYILDVYENAIGVKANFKSFFEWFRLQDDILNENIALKTRWMRRNRDWIKTEIIHIITIVKQISLIYHEGILETGYTKRYDIIDVPEILFHDLTTALEVTWADAQSAYASKDMEILSDILTTLSDIENLYYKMKTFYKLKANTSTKIFNKSILDLMKKVLLDAKKIYMSSFNITEERRIFSFLWAIFHFSLLINLWWLTEKGKNNIKKLFKKYDQQAKEFDDNLMEIFIKDIERIISSDIKRQNDATKNKENEIQIVTKTIENFIEGYSNLRIKRVPRPHMLVDKNGETFNLEQLSDGEKNLIALVGDIARRLSIANPDSKEPLKGDGIILIDEVDLHLHPAWQRLIIPKLTELFPNCQFFITTHSPQVLSHVKPKNIFLLRNEKNKLSWTKPEESYGKNTDRILEDILGVTSRPQKTKKDLQEVFKLIDENKLDEALNSIDKIEKEIGSDSELAKARVLIKRKKIIGK